MTIFEAKKLQLFFSQGNSRTFALKDIDLNIEEGTFTVVMGPSGSGKSSLLHVLSGLSTPNDGSVRCLGQSIFDLSKTERCNFRRDHFGFVFQQPFLFDHLTSLENILMPLRKVSYKHVVKAKEMLVTLKLNQHADMRPPALSGGERQRVAIARALITDPAVVFADEPTAWLDKENALNVADILRKSAGLRTVIMVTHDFDLILPEDQIMTMRDGELVKNDREQASMEKVRV